MEKLSSAKPLPCAKKVGNRCSSKSESEIWVCTLARLLGCTAQTYKPCTRPPSRSKKEPRVSSRGIGGLMDGGLHV